MQVVEPTHNRPRSKQEETGSNRSPDMATWLINVPKPDTDNPYPKPPRDSESGLLICRIFDEFLAVAVDLPRLLSYINDRACEGLIATGTLPGGLRTVSTTGKAFDDAHETLSVRPNT